MRTLGSREWTDPPGGPACYVSLWALRNDQTVLLVAGSGWQHSGSGETQVVPGEGGEPSRGTQSCTWGSHCFLSPSALRGPSPSPSVRVRAKPRGQRGRSAPRIPDPSDTQKGQSQSSPPFPTRPLIPSQELLPEGGEEAERQEEATRIAAEKQTDKTGLGVSAVSSPFNRVQCGLGQGT